MKFAIVLGSLILATLWLPASAAGQPVDESTLPILHDHSGAPRAHVLALVQRAMNGLGFDPAGGEGPNRNDRVFVGKRYLAWIDQTGFYGKINALFTLNGRSGDALDFQITDPDGRPVNVFLPGEDGDGVWPTGYKGAEHVEFPNAIPERNDDPSCGPRGLCNQYGLNEAPAYKNRKIGWWQSCNVGRVSFETRFDPIAIEESDGKLKLVYEGPLTKEADMDGAFDGDACHADYLFPDGVRRRVYLRVGYELYADAPFFDRTMQLRNPEGNPPLKGDASLIGGFVVTRWPQPHYLKRISNFIRPEARDATVIWDGVSIALRAASWNDVSMRRPPANDEPVLIGWADQPIALSVAPREVAGSTLTISNVGPSDNADTGFCLCAAHGGIEMGGGLLHAGASLPIGSGGLTIEAKRRLTIAPGDRALNLQQRTYEAESDLSHGTGRLEGNSWAASATRNPAGHMAYGPYATDWGNGSGQAIFVMLIDDNVRDDEPVANLDIYDADTQEILVSREIRRQDFKKPNAYQNFALNFALTNRAGHRMETRAFHRGRAHLQVDKVTVKLASYL